MISNSRYAQTRIQPKRVLGNWFVYNLKCRLPCRQHAKPESLFGMMLSPLKILTMNMSRFCFVLCLLAVTSIVSTSAYADLTVSFPDFEADITGGIRQFDLPLTASAKNGDEILFGLDVPIEIVPDGAASGGIVFTGVASNPRQYRSC